MRENNWPPFGSDPGLPIDHQGMNDPGNDDECGCTDLHICEYHEENGLGDDVPLHDNHDDDEMDS